MCMASAPGLSSEACFGRSWLLRVVGLGFPIMRGTGLFNTRIGLLPKQARKTPCRRAGSRTCHVAPGLRDGMVALMVQCGVSLACCCCLR